MRIAVLADTHDRMPATLSAKLTKADEIWHLGDVCSPAILDALSRLGPPVRVVRGIPRTPSQAEQTDNRRASSARLRVVERIADTPRRGTVG